MCSKSNERIVSKVPMATLKEDEDEMFAFDNEIEFIEDTNESAGVSYHSFALIYLLKFPNF